MYCSNGFFRSSRVNSKTAPQSALLERAPGDTLLFQRGVLAGCRLDAAEVSTLASVSHRFPDTSNGCNSLFDRVFFARTGIHRARKRFGTSILPTGMTIGAGKRAQPPQSVIGSLPPRRAFELTVDPTGSPLAHCIDARRSAESKPQTVRGREAAALGRALAASITSVSDAPASRKGRAGDMLASRVLSPDVGRRSKAMQHQCAKTSAPTPGHFGQTAPSPNDRPRT